MNIKKLTLSVVAIVLVAGFAATATALNVIQSIPTNFGSGADAEIREQQTNPDFGGNFLGTNRGANDELATRAREKQGDGTFIGKTSSAQYMKFDISQLPVSSDSYWDGKQIFFRAYTRNANNWRAWDSEESAGIGLTEFIWRIRALDPSGTYSTSQTDQNGNAYTANQYLYDWNEGDNSDGSGITAYNAPGRKVFCSTSACETANGHTLGFYDEFDADGNVLDLGTVEMPNPNIYGNRLPQRHPLTYNDPAGDLTQLVKDARDAGLDVVTLIAHSGQDGTNFMTNPRNLLAGQNQLIAPKERTTIMTADDNIAGAFSPQLLVVPEPASLALVGFGCLGWLVVRRRR